MSRMYALTMTRPHERLQIPVPLGRRLPRGIVGWNAVLASVVVLCVGAYIIQVNRAAGRGFARRDAEKKVEALRIEVTALEDKVATLSSVRSMTERADALGFIPVDRMEFVNPGSHAYALAK